MMLLLLLSACEPDPKGVPMDSAADTDTPADTDTDTDTGPSDDADGDGVTAAEGDCDDADPAVYPGAPETWYDGVDQDCAGDGDDDADGDGVGVPEDCDDTDPDVHPGAEEVPYDGVDSNCVADDTLDVDGDGWEGPDLDCDDADADVNPGAEEVCDGATDEDCDGLVDEDADVLGAAEACPAADCLTVLRTRTAAPDGVYWIDLGGVATELVCDMTDDTGGWTLVANFVWPGDTAGVAGWTSGAAVGSTTTDRTQSFKVADDAINALVQYRYRGHGTATTCMQADYTTVSACTVDTTLYWDAACVYASGIASSGACTAAYQTYDLEGWTALSNPCPWHFGLTSADCGTTSEFGSSHEGDHVFVGVVGTFIHAYDGRPNEDPNLEVWVR